jgi:hypothetical protein
MISGGVIHIPSFMTIGSGIQVILRLLLPQQFERLCYSLERDCELLRWDDLGWHDIHTKFHKDLSGIQKLLGGHTYRLAHRQQCYFISILSFFQNKESKLKITRHACEECMYCNTVYEHFRSFYISAALTNNFQIYSGSNCLMFVYYWCIH